MEPARERNSNVAEDDGVKMWSCNVMSAKLELSPIWESVHIGKKR